MAALTRNDIYALMNATTAQLTGTDTHKVIDSQSFMDAGKLAQTYTTDEIYNALSIVGARLLIGNRPYGAKLRILDEVDGDIFNNTAREISYYSTNALPSGAFNTQLFTNLANGFDNGTNPSSGTAQSTGNMWEQHPTYPFELFFFQSEIWQDCLTRYMNQIQIVFNSEAEFGQFWSGVLEEKAADIESRKEAYNRLTLLNRMALAAAMGESTSAVKGACTVYDLTAAFNSEYGTNYSGEQLRTVYKKEFLEWFTAEIKIISNLMEKRSGYFHVAPSKQLADGYHFILRHTPKANQKMIMYGPFWEKAKATVMPEIFNDQYLKTENFEAVDYWQTFSMSDADKCTANIYATIPGWLEDLITSGSTKVDTKYTFNPDYIMGCIFDDRAVKCRHWLEAARTTPGPEARKNYMNTWYDFGKANICNPTQNFILLVMSANEPEPGDDDNAET